MKEYNEQELKKEMANEPVTAYGMDTTAMREKIVSRIMRMEDSQLKEMLRLSDELEDKSWILPQNQDELESAILKGMEDVKSGRIVSHEDVLKYYMK